MSLMKKMLQHRSRRRRQRRYQRSGSKQKVNEEEIFVFIRRQKVHKIGTGVILKKEHSVCNMYEPCW